MRDINFCLAICTHNRALQLRAALDGLLSLELPEDCGYEFMVVDNASTDNTAKVVAEYQQQCNRLRYVVEPELGLTYARNRAIKETEREILIYLDDDAVPDRGLLHAYREAYIGASDEVACIGGRIELVLPHVQLPAWFSESLHAYLSAFRLDAEAIHECTHYQHPYGANISFRRSALETIGCFNNELWKYTHRADETEVCQRLANAGWRVLYQPRALVYHHIPQSRLTKRYFYYLARESGPARVILERGGQLAVSDWEQLCRHSRRLSQLTWYLLRTTLSQRERSLPRAFRIWLEVRTEWAATAYCIRHLRSRPAGRKA